MVIAFELEITFRTAKCRFSPPSVLTVLRQTPPWRREAPLASYLASSARVKLKIFGMPFGAHVTRLFPRLPRVSRDLSLLFFFFFFTAGRQAQRRKREP